MVESSQTLFPTGYSLSRGKSRHITTGGIQNCVTLKLSGVVGTYKLHSYLIVIMCIKIEKVKNIFNTTVKIVTVKKSLSLDSGKN